MADRRYRPFVRSRIFNRRAEPVWRDGVNIRIPSGEFAMDQTLAERRAGCLAKAQSAEGCRFKTADEDIRQAYANLAKSWVNLADSIPAVGEKQPH